MKTQHEILMGDPEYRRLYAIEGLIADAAELVARLMEEQGVKKAALARRLGKSRAWVTQLLSGKANMTIRTFAEIVHVLGAQVKLSTQAEATRQDGSALRRQWADTIHPSCFASPWQMQPETQFAYGDYVPPSLLEKQDHTEHLERPEYAA
jgi:transcriptional regulator with XRE-family HTH domain